ncbi:hypothetical protein FSARC_3422 [Fusarium sarcochroum]|uniref:AB hydrolase-1 domain-containing protein n=1 Tax=Fusarium sarcochroum TaxID=1208366 RepID=A0A8H4XBX4_9HYPO|nr:hypothetical protein FSARC_3422 [Fusarium sarcochroum]
MPRQTSFVFIPGSWHKPSCYDKIIEPLQVRHHLRCVPVTLPSTMDDPMATFKDDIDATRYAIINEMDKGSDVIVVAHSYGGMVGNSAVKGLTRPVPVSAETSPSNKSSSRTPMSDVRDLGKGFVVGLILIATGFTLTGIAFMDPFFGHPPPSWRINKETGFADLVVRPQELFYHDLPPAEADEQASMLTTQSLKALFEGGEHAYSGWLDVPVWYIGTIDDNGLPIAVQRIQVGMARAMGGNVVHTEMRTSHSPFLSQPAQVMQIFLQAFQAFTGQGSHDRLGVLEMVTGQGLPVVKLWQPITWYRFGLPLGVGNVIGWSIISYRRVRGLWESLFR